MASFSHTGRRKKRTKRVELLFYGRRFATPFFAREHSNKKKRQSAIVPSFSLFFLGTVSSLLVVKQQGEEEDEEEEGRSRVKQNKIFVFWKEENQMQLGSFVLLFAPLANLIVTAR